MAATETPLGRVNRRGRVLTSLSLLKLQMADSLAGTNPRIPRPIWGGNTTGLHYQPQPYDEVIALAEVNGWHSTVVPAITIDPTAANYRALPVMNPGETAIFGADGRQVAYVKSDGTTLLYSKPSGAAITVSPAQDLLLQTPAGGTITYDAGSTGTHSFIGAATFAQTIDCAGIFIGTTTELTGCIKYSGTVTVTLAATSFSGGSLTTITYTPATWTAPSATWSAATIIAPTTGATTTTVWVASSSGGSTTSAFITYPSGQFSTFTNMVSGLSFSPGSFSAGSLAGGVYTPGTLSLGYGTLATLTITGARPGDFCQVAISALDSHPEIGLRASCTANDTVKIFYTNLGQSAVVLTGATVLVLVTQAT